MCDPKAGKVSIDAAVEVTWQLYANAVSTLGAELLAGSPFVTIDRIDNLMKKVHYNV